MVMSILSTGQAALWHMHLHPFLELEVMLILMKMRLSLTVPLMVNHFISST